MSDADWAKLMGTDEAAALAETPIEAALPLLDPEFWFPKSPCNILLTMLKAMSRLERHAFLTHPEVRDLIKDALDKEAVEWAKRDVAVLKAVSDGKVKKLSRKAMKPYWIKSVEKLDYSERAMKRVVGDWVIDPAEQCDTGEVLLIGLRFPVKAYALAKAYSPSKDSGKIAAAVPVFRAYRPDVNIRGLMDVTEFSDFGTAMATLELAFPETS